MNSDQLCELRVPANRFRSAVALARLFLVFSCVLLVAEHSHAEERHFKGRTNGELNISSTATPWIFTSQDTATGNGTHVGVCKMTGFDVIDISSLWVVGGFTWRTANGDLLSGVYSGPMAFSSPDSISWLFNATILGGTGRFQHATGEFVFNGQAELVTTDGTTIGRFTETFDGIIDY